MKVTEIQRISFNVKNCDEAVKFWTDLLGLNFPPLSHAPVALRQKLGKIVRSQRLWHKLLLDTSSSGAGFHIVQDCTIA